MTFIVLVYGSTIAQDAGQNHATKAMQNVECSPAEEFELDSENNLIRCVLNGDQQFLNENSDMVPCKSGTEVLFNENGFLTRGILSEDKAFINSAGETVNCLSGDEVSFDTNGLLMPRN